jgi:hypothetical protein
MNEPELSKISRRRWLWALVPAGLAIATGAFLLVSAGDSDRGPDDLVTARGGTVSRGPIKVVVPPGAVREKTRIRVETTRDSATRLLPGTARRSPAYEISTDSRLLKPVTIRIAVGAKGLNGRTLFAATREQSDEMWVLRSGHLDQGTNEFVVHTRSLSIWQLVEVVKNAIVDAGVAATSAFLQVGGARATEPDCDQAPVGLALEGDTGGGDANALVFGCLESHAQGMAIRVVNNRAIGMEFQVPNGLHVTDAKSPEIPDEVLDIVRSVLSDNDFRIVSAGGDVTLAGPASETELVVHPTLGSFVFDVAVFTAGRFGGKTGKAAQATSEFLDCARSAVDRVGHGIPVSARAALDAALGMWRDCGATLAKAGAGASATAAAVFFGGVKLGAGATDALAALLNEESAKLRVVEAPVGPGTTCGVIDTGRTFRPHGDIKVRFRVEVRVEGGEILCSEALHVARRYELADNPCVNAGNTCPLTQEGWRCDTPTAGSFPITLRCDNGGIELVGTDPDPLPTSGDVRSCGTAPGVTVPGPFKVRSNLKSCKQAQGLAETELYGTGPNPFDFDCNDRVTGFESSETTCRFKDVVLIYESGV